MQYGGLYNNMFEKGVCFFTFLINLKGKKIHLLGNFLCIIDSKEIG